MKNNPPKISVIIPALNEEKYIQTCLASLLNQTDKPDEIIVIDNNSTDNTVLIAQQFPVRIVSEKKQGIIYARNRGFDEAQYEILARCDADTHLPPFWISQIKKQMSFNHIDALTGPISYYDLVLDIVPIKLYLIIMKKFLKGHEVFTGPNMVIKKSAWEKIKKSVCLDELLVHEDIDLAIHLFQHGLYLYKDSTLIVQTSARRMKKQFFSFFFEYPSRVFKTLKTHDLI